MTGIYQLFKSAASVEMRHRQYAVALLYAWFVSLIWPMWRRQKGRAVRGEGMRGEKLEINREERREREEINKRDSADLRIFKLEW